MIPQWKMNGKDMRFDGSIEIVVEVRDLFNDLVVTLWVDQEESGSIAVKTLAVSATVAIVYRFYLERSRLKRRGVEEL